MPYLCTSQALEGYKKLVEAESVGVAYPAARLLMSLAQCSLPDVQAAAIFADRQLLNNMIDKVSSPKTCELVRQQMHQALDTVLDRFGPILSQGVKEEMNQRLDAARAAVMQQK